MRAALVIHSKFLTTALTILHSSFPVSRLLPQRQVVSKKNTHLSSPGLTRWSPQANFNPFPYFHSSLPVQNWNKWQLWVQMVLTSAYIVTSPFKYNFIKNWYSQMHAYKALDYFLAHPQTRQISSEQNRGIANGDVGLSKKRMSKFRQLECFKLPFTSVILMNIGI